MRDESLARYKGAQPLLRSRAVPTPKKPQRPTTRKSSGPSSARAGEPTRARQVGNSVADAVQGALTGKSSRPSSAKAGNPTRARQVGNSVADAVQGAFTGALTDAAKDVITNAASGLSPALALRRARREAEEYARAVEGRYRQVQIARSQHRMHYVVWKDGKPIRAFPEVEDDVFPEGVHRDLAALPDIQHVAPSQLREPPTPRKRRVLRRG